MRRTVLRFLVLSALIFSLFTPFRSAHAATFIVDSTMDLADPTPGDGNCQASNGACTFRAAIQTANATVGDDTITLPAGIYTLTIAGTGEDAAVTGDLDITRNLTITGAGAGTTIIQAGTLGVGGPPNGIDRVFHLIGNPGPTVNISGITIRNGNLTAADGAGIFYEGNLVLTITDCIFSGNSTTTNGGAIYSGSGNLNITTSTFSGNSAGIGGGGIASNSSAVTITRSTFIGNHANSPDYGGGAISNGYRLTIANSTFSGNSAVNFGGGIRNGSSVNSSTNITNSTFSGNSASSGGAVYNSGAGPLVLYNTILAYSPSGGNCGGTTITNGVSNIDDGTTCAWGSGSGSMSSTDPLLGPLVNNGGPTQTFALLAGSPAINAANDSICAAAVGSPGYGAGLVDQRGIARPVGEHCDIGAFEGTRYRVLMPLVFR